MRIGCVSGFTGFSYPMSRTILDSEKRKGVVQQQLGNAPLRIGEKKFAKEDMRRLNLSPYSFANQSCIRSRPRLISPDDVA
jgi:hypothetical protein